MDPDQIQQSAQVSPVFNIIFLVLVVIMLVAGWKVFTKAGEPRVSERAALYNSQLTNEFIAAATPPAIFVAGRGDNLIAALERGLRQ